MAASMKEDAEEEEDNEEDEEEKEEKEDEEESEEESDEDSEESESEESGNETASESEAEVCFVLCILLIMSHCHFVIFAQDAPTLSKKENLEPRLKKHEGRLSAMKKCNVLLQANVDNLQDEISQVRYKASNLQSELDSVLADLGF